MRFGIKESEYSPQAKDGAVRMVIDVHVISLMLPRGLSVHDGTPELG
jgi:hypothetical protein